jgi:hypothetical protein
MMRTLYIPMRPYVSGAAYVDYCDLDLDLGDGYAKAYWADNLPRLMQIKARRHRLGRNRRGPRGGIPGTSNQSNLAAMEG